MKAESVRRLLRAECKLHGDETIFARKAGVSPALVSAILRGKREPRGRVLQALNLELIVSYRPKKTGAEQ